MLLMYKHIWLDSEYIEEFANGANAKVKHSKVYYIKDVNIFNLIF